MNKKSKQKSQAKTTAMADADSDIAIAPAASKAPQLRLDDLRAAAAAHIDNHAWSEIAALGRVPLADIHEDDRKSAEVWLLRAKILGLKPPGSTTHIDFMPKEVREEYIAALKGLAAKVDALHTLPEFNQYLETLGWSVGDRAEAFRRLSRACMEMTNLHWLRELRNRTFGLLRAQENPGDPLSAADQEIMAALPDLTLTLSEAFAAAEQGGALDDEGQAVVKVMRLDLDLMMADAWDYERVGEALLRLPSPTEAEVAGMYTDDSSDGSRLKLTPRAWAFMWMLQHASAEGMRDLLQRFPEPFACDPCEGLRRVMCALHGIGDVDQNMATAVRLLMRFANDSPYWFGEYLTMTVGDGVREIHLGSANLHMGAVDDMLLRLYEQAPEDFPRLPELRALYRIYSAAVQFSALEDEDDADEGMPGLAWLCEQSISFQFAAAYAIQGVAGRMRLLLDAMRRTTEAGLPPPQNYYSGDLDEGLDEPEAGPVLEALEKLAAVRESMDSKTQQMWLAVAGDIFSALSKLGDKVRKRLLPLARFFRDDLLEMGHAFRLAYLEQVAGDPVKALRYYLAYIQVADDPASAINNAKLLWANSESLDEVQQLVDTLEEDLNASSRADAVRELLTDAKARLAALNKQDQFERTAVTRWPTLTAPARKLLSVFGAIKSYNGLAEVAEYAGMELKWAEKHYDKLVDLGMLLTTEKHFRINPHIAPLLEREAQHAVVGRIVRAQGTSAVKQVFNSQREFTIYQVLVQLCPNHLVFPNCSLQSVMSFDRMKELASEDDFGYYLRASVDIVVVSSTTYLPMLAIEVDSVWHDTERQQRNDDKKDRLFAAAGIPFLRLRPVGSPSENTIRAQVAEHVEELVRSLRSDLPGYDQARGLLEDLSGIRR